MTCRHSPDDPNCSSYQPPTTPNASNYTVEAVEQVGSHLVMKIRYPNCAKCSFEGNKIMVFLNTKTIDACTWKKIDPHFQNVKFRVKYEAPSPSARFPGDEDGWADAIVYAKGKGSNE